MNKESLKEYLSSRYQGWGSFLNNIIFPIFGEDDFEDGFETELLESQPERRQLAEAIEGGMCFDIVFLQRKVFPVHVKCCHQIHIFIADMNNIVIQRTKGVALCAVEPVDDGPQQIIDGREHGRLACAIDAKQNRAFSIQMQFKRFETFEMLHVKIGESHRLHPFLM